MTVLPSIGMIAIVTFLYRPSIQQTSGVSQFEVFGIGFPLLYPSIISTRSKS